MEEAQGDRARVRAVSLAAVLVLVLGAVASYQLGKPESDEAPRARSYSKIARGNRTVVTAEGAGTIELPALDPTVIPDFSAATPAPPLPKASAPSTTAPRPATTALAAVAVGPLALGAYTFSVAGSESATGFGTRQYPPTMTLTASRAAGLSQDHAGHDLSFSPEHQERATFAYRPDAVALTFESGTITFGPSTQRSETDYAPAMVQIPLPLRAGDRRSGTTQARAKNGSVTRTEDWTVKVLRQETVRIAGEAVSTWVVVIDRKTRPGSAETARRTRTYWYDPARRMWVKWKETAHTERKTVGVTFVYDSNYEATLTRFAPA